MTPRLPTHDDAQRIPLPLSDIEIARMWRSLAVVNTPRPVPRGRPRRRLQIVLGIASAVIAAAGAFAVAMIMTPAEDSATTSTVAGEMAADGVRHELELPDGSRITHDPEARVRIVSAAPEDVELVLLRGGIEVVVPDAAPEARRFLLAAGDFDVVTRGAHLRVLMAGSASQRRLEVTVLTGQAQVHRPSADRAVQVPLSAGETWSSDSPALDLN